MTGVRGVFVGAVLAAGSLVGAGLPASAATAAVTAAPASTAGAPASCAVSVQELGTLVLSRSVGVERARLSTTCVLEAPLTLVIAPVGAATQLGTIVFSGYHGVIRNDAVGVIHLTARAYEAGHTYRVAPGRAHSADGRRAYATAPQRFVVKTLGVTRFTSEKIDRRHVLVHATGQESVFSFTAGHFVARSGSVVGSVRAGSKGGWKRDTSDPRITFTRAGRTTWNVRLRCGRWQYRMIQPSTRAVVSIPGNILVTSRSC